MKRILHSIFLTLSLVLSIGSVACSNNITNIELSVISKELTVEVNKETTIEYNVTPKDTTLVFSSNDDNIAKVSTDGVIKGVSIGQVSININAKNREDIHETVKVNVTPNTDYSKLRFNEDGSFRIMQINDFQDDQDVHPKSLHFLNTILDKYKPDLVVLVGDQLDGGNLMSVDDIKTALNAELEPLEERKIPFLFTFGNHDHDHDSTLDRNGQSEIYDSYSMCYASHNGPDKGTYNNLIYDKNGIKPALNIYMMDTNEWYENFMVSGVNPTQVQWYKEKSDELKALNNDTPLPSLLFEHIPVKEMSKFLKEAPMGTEGGIGSMFNDKCYVIDENAILVGDRNVMKEPICSENPNKITGQYESWVEKGDIIGAYFGHDHVNTLVGKTADGIVMGYNGGFGFSPYGDGDERFARIYDFKEDNITNYTMKTLLYTVETSS